MKTPFFFRFIIPAMALLFSCSTVSDQEDFYTLSKDSLKDKIMGAWALQTIGVTYGGPTEFRYLKRMIPDSVQIQWADTAMLYAMTYHPGLYDDIYMDLTFVEVLEKEGMDAPASSFGTAYSNAEYWLWHANQQGRYNILNGIMPPASGHWINNPHAEDIDFQIEADFAGIMNPGMPNSASETCDPVGHVMNSGDGYYGGVYMAAMYSNAFVMNDIKEVVIQSLSIIPKESTFYQCISDVIQWYKMYPEDWKKTWGLVEEKWGDDIGCPDGVHQDFNIDAKINSAYVVMGLLYGNGDIEKTMDISTRCGQDSDCNPASSAGILGAMIGYKSIPQKWSGGLPLIEDMDFKYTTISLNDVYGMSYRHALKRIEGNGGKIEEENVKILKQTPKEVPLEQNFTGYNLNEKRSLNLKVASADSQEMEWKFEGIGVVLRGRVNNEDFKNLYALEGPEQTLNGYVIKAEFFIDGESMGVVNEPLDFIKRNHELFFKYELPEGNHVLKMKVLNPHPDIFLEFGDLLVYQKTR